MADKTIKETINAHASELMSISGVIGVAEGKHQESPCIILFVNNKNPELLKQIPKNLEGYPIIVEESGRFRALDK